MRDLRLCTGWTCSYMQGLLSTLCPDMCLIIIQYGLLFLNSPFTTYLVCVQSSRLIFSLRIISFIFNLPCSLYSR